MSAIAIAGAGAFGTALAISFARAGHDVTLWARDPARAAEIRERRRNDARLPGAELPPGLAVTADLGDLGTGILILAVPTQRLGEFLASERSQIDGRQLVLCCKGIDLATGLRPSLLTARHCPASPCAVMTGPSFAEDIARDLPTALTLATERDGEALQRALSTPTIRLYLTHDVIGAELGGALKNVVALAAGLTVGAGLGESARAAVVTRGFAEMTRFAVSERAKPETLAGLSGFGDLLLTCTSSKSRNYAAGLALGRGEALPHDRTIEGLATAEAVSALARQRGIDLPLADMVSAVTHGRMTVAEAAEALMARPLRKE